MDGIDLGQLIGIVTKGGPAAIILAVFLGAAQLVREVRGGKVGAQRETDLNAKIASLETRVKTLTDGMERMEVELERALDLVHSMRYQRDQARIRVEFLEQLHSVEPRTVWPPEPGQAAINPAVTQVLPPIDLAPPGGGTP